MRHNVNAVCDKFSLAIEVGIQKIRSIVHKINTDKDQPSYFYDSLIPLIRYSNKVRQFKITKDKTENTFDLQLIPFINLLSLQ